MDDWGASEIIELLLQLVQRQGFYADNLEWINVRGLQICGSISSTNALSKISARFLGINQFLQVSAPTHADMLVIVQSRLEPLLLSAAGTSARKPNSMLTQMQYVVEGLMDFYNKVCDTNFAGNFSYAD